MSSISSAVVCLIACHGGPADHFATYAEILSKNGYEVQIYATGDALKKFKARGINVKNTFSLENLAPKEEDLLAQEIAKTCSKASVILTDIGHRFDIKIQKALSVHATKVPRFAYYDNPEPFVPGGYSSIAAQVISAAESVLFANANLAHDKIFDGEKKDINFEGKKRFGIGYYPVEQAKMIAEKRKTNHATTRAAFFMDNGIAENGQKLLVYFGGNNDEYFDSAFPKFLSFIAEASQKTDLSNLVVLIHQHPGAKEKNRDGEKLAKHLEEFKDQTGMPQLILSNFPSSDDPQVLADAALYYQTSMGPQFVLGGIPSIQIGHETYADILVRNNFAPTVTTTEGFIQAIEQLEEMDKHPENAVLKGLGTEENWPERLKQIVGKSVLPN